MDKYLGKLDGGTVSESMNNVNAIIVNTHFVFGDSRPLPPGIIEVGGCTYNKPMPLPEVSILTARTYLAIYNIIYGHLSKCVDVHLSYMIQMK